MDELREQFRKMFTAGKEKQDIKQRVEKMGGELSKAELEALDYEESAWLEAEARARTNGSYKEF
jgi:hypothetical protein